MTKNRPASPLPWKRGHLFQNNAHEMCNLRDAEGKLVATTAPFSNATQNKLDDAEFIEEAVNSHYAMRTVLMMWLMAYGGGGVHHTTALDKAAVEAEAIINPAGPVKS